MVALNCGAGPGLVAMLVGMVLLDGIVLPHIPLMPMNGFSSTSCLVISLLVGLSITLLASQSGWARRRAEYMARSLKLEQTRSEAERQRLRTLLEVLPAAVGMVDAEGRFAEINPALEALWGSDSHPGEIGQLGAHHGWWPASGQPVAAEEWAIVRALQRGEIVRNEEVEELVDGQRKALLHSAAPIRNASGTIIGVAGILQDITERRRLERRTSEALHALLAMAEALVQAQHAPAHPQATSEAQQGLERDPCSQS